MKQNRTLLVTSALPYANGDIHLGHLLGYVQADIWVRFQRLQGHTVHYICGDDAHGTPIMLSAEKANISPEALVAKMHAEHYADFAAFNIEFDNYHSTHSEENQSLVNDIYQTLQTKGLITRKTIEQAYDPCREMFLPDRFVKGTCPQCGATDQYGDSCEVCGATYAPLDMIAPRSVVSGATPICKQSQHLFFDLPQLTEALKQWVSNDHLQPEVVNKLQEWFADGLKPWDISRDAPYFGFNIPGEPDKYFYVWLDAPIGYMSSFAHYCQRQQLSFDDYWGADSQHELYHFIGKDIIYFHALFWPAVCLSGGYRTPTAIFANGFVTLNGQKMSKSRGTFIRAKTYAKHLDPCHLRYYYAAKLTTKIEDIDLNWSDFKDKVNADVVGKYVNIASRASRFLDKYFNNTTVPLLDKHPLHDYVKGQKTTLALAYEQRTLNRVVRIIMESADRINQYFDQQKPWAHIKQDTAWPQVHQVISLTLELFRLLTCYLHPIMPVLTTQAKQFLNITDLAWHTIDIPMQNHQINRFQPLTHRIEEKEITAMLEETTPTSDADKAKPAATCAAIKPQISIDDFSKIDLRVAKIINACTVEGADKLIEVTLDIGDEQRRVFAGIKSAYPEPRELIGQYAIVVANLAPRKMRFGLSEGMLLAASDGKSGLFLVHPASGARAGMTVK